MRRLIELMDSEDERVAAVACNAILDRAFGKPNVAETPKDDVVARIAAMSHEERVEQARQLLERLTKIAASEVARSTPRRLRLASEVENRDEC